MSCSLIEFRSFVEARATRPDAPLPDDPTMLARYHKLAGDLLERMAARVEPDWDLAEAALAEIDRLLVLQARILRHLADRPAASLEDVALKLSLWALARRGVDPRELPPEDALVHSAMDDLAALARARAEEPAP
jgi:hypothetical protein